MSYPRGKLCERIRLYNPVSVPGQYGSTVTKYIAEEAPIWAWVTWVRGARALHAGHNDTYHSLMIRCDCHTALTPYTRIEWLGRFYIIDSFNADRRLNECQITCYMVDDINT